MSMPWRLLGVAGGVTLLALGGVGAVPVGAAVSVGTPHTFGTNTYGQFGDGSPINEPRTSPEPVSGLTNVTQIAGGREHVLALRTDGTVWAWGSNAKGQIGDGSSVLTRPQPVSVAGLNSIEAIAAGHYHSMALRADGTAWVWGFNSLGQLGDGTKVKRRRRNDTATSPR